MVGRKIQIFFWFFGGLFMYIFTNNLLGLFQEQCHLQIFQTIWPWVCAYLYSLPLLNQRQGADFSNTCSDPSLDLTVQHLGHGSLVTSDSSHYFSVSLPSVRVIEFTFGREYEWRPCCVGYCVPVSGVRIANDCLDAWNFCIFGTSVCIYSFNHYLCRILLRTRRSSLIH